MAFKSRHEQLALVFNNFFKKLCVKGLTSELSAPVGVVQPRGPVRGLGHHDLELGRVQQQLSLHVSTAYE